MSGFGLYVHLPFCPYICPYCDFVKWPVRAGAARRYLPALHAQIAQAAQDDTLARDLARSNSTVFLGGGTPNAYEPSDIADLLARLQAAFPGDPERETTIEVNPELVRTPDMQTYRRAGITRVSIGVQSFVAQEIGRLGRGHTAQDVQRVVEECRAAGMRSVSLDLMFAVPGQTRKSWLRTLRAAIALEVDHVSAYGLTVEEGTPYERWREREPGAFFDDAREAELYDLAIRTLEDAGYEQYEISNFARPGHRSEHNANYWSNGDYIGLGVGAASYRNGVRSVCTKDFETYVTTALEGRAVLCDSEQLQGAQRCGEAVMLSLRTTQGVCLQAFKERYGVNFLEFYAPVISRCRADGLLEVDATHARLSRRGRFVANDVCAAFVTSA